MGSPLAVAGWISSAAAQGILGVGRGTLDRLVRDGELTVRSVPGMRPRYDKAEVEMLAEAWTHRRKTPAAAG